MNGTPYPDIDPDLYDIDPDPPLGGCAGILVSAVIATVGYAVVVGVVVWALW